LWVKEIMKKQTKLRVLGMAGLAAVGALKLGEPVRESFLGRVVEYEVRDLLQLDSFDVPEFQGGIRFDERSKLYRVDCDIAGDGMKRVFLVGSKNKKDITDKVGYRGVRQVGDVSILQYRGNLDASEFEDENYSLMVESDDGKMWESAPFPIVQPRE
jgi:hypothetical protein